MDQLIQRSIDFPPIFAGFFFLSLLLILKSANLVISQIFLKEKNNPTFCGYKINTSCKVKIHQELLGYLHVHVSDCNIKISEGISWSKCLSWYIKYLQIYKTHSVIF